ncbi:MAG: LytTR family DNA-binding domain-containing protein [Ferruginibacter sp.]
MFSPVSQNRSFTNKFLWTITYLIISLSFVFIANDNSFQFLLNNRTFYTDILFSLTVTFGIGFYLVTLNSKLNRSCPWRGEFRKRLFRQLIMGIVFPLAVAIGLEMIYLHFINIPLQQSSILNFELPLSFIFLVLVNLISIAGYLVQHPIKEEIIINEQVMATQPRCIQYLTVQRGFTEEKIEINNCAFIRSSDKLLWVHTFEGEKYRLTGTLEEWEEKLRPSNFYRINRQYLSSFKAIRSVELTETRKLKVNFSIPTDDVFISKPRVADFRLWWKQ